ncbi:MAG: cobalt transporter CbiM [Planctomycetota bacterium]|nr:MAG: cobalt transporter CbiM [Planctomycetota bacterium]
MHVPDGYLSPASCAALTAGVIPAWVVSARRLRQRLGTRRVPELALGAAFSFVVMMFNVPAPGGTTGHAVGAGLVAILVGPEAAIVSTTVALAIQALLFGDGGILSLGANCFNLAFLMPVTSYALYRALTPEAASHRRRALGAAVAAYVGLNVAALATAVELGLQPLVAHDAAGAPLYCPFGLGVSVPAMLLPHLLVFGWVEAVATGSVVAWASRSGTLAEVRPAQEVSPRPLWAGLGVLCLSTPLGLLAAGEAWGEWDTAGVRERAGAVPGGMERFGGLWSGLLPDYALPGWESGPWLAAAYVASALLGAGLVIFLAWGTVRLLTALQSEPAMGVPALQGSGGSASRSGEAEQPGRDP